MPVYQVGDNEYELPDDLSQEDLAYALEALYTKDNPQDIPPPSPNTPYPQAPDSVDPDLLSGDGDWLRASQHIYKLNEGRDWQGADSDLAEYGLDYMGWFNYNLPKMGYEAGQLKKAPQEQKEAFLYLMDTYDNLEMSWGGAGRFFKGVLTDPTTYAGLATLGFGSAVAQGGKAATKTGLKELLKQSLSRTGIVAGVEGGIYTGVDNRIRQGIEVDAGRKTEVDGKELALSTGIGVAGGLVGGTLLDAAATRITGMFRKTAEAETSISEVLEEAAQANKTQQQAQASASRPQADTVVDGAETLPATQSELPDVIGEGEVRPVQGELLESVDVDGMNIPPLKTPLPFESTPIDEQKRIAYSIAEELSELDGEQVASVVNDLRSHKMTAKEWNRFKTSVVMARDEAANKTYNLMQAMKRTNDPEEQAKLYQQYERAYKQLGQLMSLDEPLASDSGQVLGIRSRFMDLKGVDLNDPETLFSTMEQLKRSQQVSDVVKHYESKIRQAEDTGDFGEVGRLKALRDLEVEDELGKLMKDSGVPEGGINRRIAQYNELAISNVFSATTVAINLVPSGIKTILRPALDGFLSNPLDAAVRQQTMATYSMMGASVRGAFESAIAAFKYEQAVLTRESGRLMEGGMMMGGGKRTGKIAGAIRTLPRILNASDEFLSRLGYNGFIAGDAAGKAFKEGLEKGLKGKALDRYVKEQAKQAVEASLGTKGSDEAVRTLIHKGRNLGYRDERLALYVKTEMEKSGEALRHGTNDEALDYVRDLLYKRQFGGKNMASSVAKSYEELTAKYPIMRVLGQLFFRTPVRVFEEGFRLTPGLQLITPNFMRDLTGKNGARAQVKARGEALLSFAIAGFVIQKYAEGKIVGSGAYDHWKQERARTDSDLPEEYTLKDDDGSTWSFRSFDPVAVPMKIMVNALERLEKYNMRHQQGEFDNKAFSDKAMAAITVAIMPITEAIRDANLMSGVDQLLEIGETMSDPEAGGDVAAMKFLINKLRVLTPNTLHKLGRTNDPYMDDPITFWQMVNSRVLHGLNLEDDSSPIPQSYDVLGNVRKMNDTGMLWNIFSESTVEERKKDRTEQELKVLRALDGISKQTGVTFAMPYQHNLVKGLDLRHHLTSDGQETLYDRWVRYFREQPVTATLESLIDSGMPVGTHSINGATVEAIQKVLNQYRTAAFMRVLSEEARLSDKFLQYNQRKAEVRSGFWDQ